ncbi:MAG: inositol monophosphatase [Saccharofermentans sp.]|nr:inositol monophosphatase [Saccharofermentans sp.]
MDSTTKTLLDEIISVARFCGDIILNADRSDIGIKDKEGRANFVTEYDCKVQKVAQEKLQKILPEAEFLGEEDNSEIDSSREYVFVVDPIDGTTNFIKDYHTSCISIGLVKGGKRYLGVVFNPYLDEMFYAVKGEGAYLNGKKIHVSSEELSNGIVLFGSSPYNQELSKASFELAYKYFQKALDIRRSGSAAIDLCSIAAGRAELYFEMILSPWDFAAGALIVEEAGGIITTLEGEEVPCFEKSSILARNKEIL